MGQPEVFWNLKGNSRVYEWLKKNERFILICGAILAVIHPEQYETSLKILTCIEEEPTCLREPEYAQSYAECMVLAVLWLCNHHEP